MENTARVPAHKIITAASIAAVIILAMTTIASCNGKARAEARYDTYHQQAEATIGACHLQIDQQATTIARDSATIAADRADMAQVNKLAIAAAATLQQINTIAETHTGQ